MTLEQRICVKIDRWAYVYSRRFFPDDHYSYLALGRLQAYREVLKMIKDGVQMNPTKKRELKRAARKVKQRIKRKTLNKQRAAKAYKLSPKRRRK